MANEVQEDKRDNNEVRVRKYIFHTSVGRSSFTQEAQKRDRWMTQKMRYVDENENNLRRKFKTKIIKKKGREEKRAI